MKPDQLPIHEVAKPRTISSRFYLLAIALLLGAANHADAQNVFVETLRFVSPTGPKKPEYSVVLRSVLQKKGLIVIQPDPASKGGDGPPSNVPSDLYLVMDLVLKDSKLDANSICGLMAPSSNGSMIVGASLKDPKGTVTALKDANVSITLTKNDLNCSKNDLTSAGFNRVMTEVFTPIADQVVAIVKKK